MKFDNPEIKNDERIDKILIKADKFAETNEDLIYCVEEQRFFLWKDNYFQPLLEIQLERYLLLNNSDYQCFNINQLKNFMHRLATLKQVTLDEMNAQDIIDLENGVYDFGHDKFVDHDRSYLSTVRIPYSYDPDATSPTWESFLKTSLEGDMERISILQEYMGYCLGRDNGFHKALILLGEGRNGKGTTFSVIERLVGSENTCALKLGDMRDKEAVGNLVGKLVNIDGDTDTSATNYESDFRRITAGDSMMARKLYKDAFTFIPYVKLVIGANDLPHIADKTRGFYDRLIIIPFNISFAGREDYSLKMNLAREISGIFNWALEGRRRLYERGRFSIGKSLAERVAELKMENNPVEAFSYECVRAHDDAKTLKRDMYENYVAWCKENGHRPLSKIRFGKEFYRINRDRTDKDGRDGSEEGGRMHIWPGLYIVGGWQAPVEEVSWDEG